MEQKGKVIKILEPTSGITKSKGNPWMAQTYILKTQESQPRHFAFEVFGEDRIKSMNIHLGEDLVVFFDIDAREYQGRWYNQIRAWKVERQVLDPALPIVPEGPTPVFQTTPFTGPLDPLPFDDPNDQLDFPF